MIANGVNDFLIKTGRRIHTCTNKETHYPPDYHPAGDSLCIARKSNSLFSVNRNTGDNIIGRVYRFCTPGDALPNGGHRHSSPSIDGYPIPPVDTQPIAPVAATESQGTPSSQYPGPGEVQSSTPTPTQEITGGNPYPTPGSPVFLTSTSTSNLTYPGQATDSFSTPQATFLFSTPQFDTPTAVPLVTLEARTPVPPPAWINSQLRASDLSDVKLSLRKNPAVLFLRVLGWSQPGDGAAGACCGGGLPGAGQFCLPG